MNGIDQKSLEPKDSNQLPWSAPKEEETMRGLPVLIKNVSCRVRNSQNRKETITILDGVSGFMRPGEMVALMGPSGSGKTTLMDILSSRKTVGSIEGEILMGGHKPTKTYLRRYTGYVEQFDTLIHFLTVEEMLVYTAELKRPVEQTQEERLAAVEGTIHALGLESCRGVKIGSSLARGISGGQAKRVNIGLALVTSPRVLFLDEPTSGLDSYTSNEVMTVVKHLANRGLTVLATIHSPTPYCFNLFDRLLLLLKGNVVYFGDSGNTAVEYFTKCTPVIKGLMDDENEAEWIVDVTVQADRQGRAIEYAEAWQASAQKKETDELLETLISTSDETLDEESKKELAVQRETTTPSWWALGVLMRRRAFKAFGQPDFVMPRISGTILFSLIIFTLYWKKGENLSPSNLYNINSVLFMWVVLPAYNAASTMPTLVLERHLFTRERNDGVYRVVTFLMYKMLEETIVLGLASVTMSLLVFFTVKLQGLWVMFFLMNFLTMLTGTMLGYWFAALSPNMDVANAILPLYVTIQLMFSGFLIPTAFMRDYWRWAANIDFIRYSWGALMKNQYNGDRNVIMFEGTDVQILNYYELAGINMWGWMGIELVFLTVFSAFTWLTLSYLKHERR